ncbi:DUF748 domain-containing protein [uncultured Halopseudomonas sp.]|uniref:DUF748 domain-containing protein n=1 Tax=uncultured Halopseudomonas sp. TaxID=2901193 RepID=UPI0030EE3E4F
MRKKYGVTYGVLAVIIILLVILHLSLASLVRYLLNENMAQMGDYTGSVEGVELYWWRGAYELHNLRIEKIEGDVQAPLLEAPLIDIAISWKALWEQRALVSVIRFTGPELTFVDAQNEQDKQAGEGVDWRETLQDQLPITMNELQVVDGVLAFRNFSTEPQVNLYANNVDLTIYNLSTAEDLEGTRDASLEGTAMFLGHAPIEAHAAFDPLVRMEDFAFRLRVTDVELPRINDFASVYGNFDFQAGSGELVIEVSVEDGELQGYVKPLMRDVQIFDFEQDIQNSDKGVLRGMWEALVGGGEAVLKNQLKDQLATRVTLGGTLDDTEVSPLQAFFGILRNGFIEAFNSGFDRREPGEG